MQGDLPLVADAGEKRPTLRRLTICEEGLQCRLPLSECTDRVHQDEAKADPKNDVLQVGHVARIHSVIRAGAMCRREEVADAMLRCADSVSLWARAKRHARVAMQTPQALDGPIRWSLELPYDQCLMKPASRTADFQVGIAGQPSRGVVGRAAERCGGDEYPSPEQVLTSTQGLRKSEEEAGGQPSNLGQEAHHLQTPSWTSASERSLPHFLASHSSTCPRPRRRMSSGVWSGPPARPPGDLRRPEETKSPHGRPRRGRWSCRNAVPSPPNLSQSRLCRTRSTHVSQLRSTAPTSSYSRVGQRQLGDRLEVASRGAGGGAQAAQRQR
mmetsp:Transcript_69197/g.198482  ORF Transcript_69197/g.198482 Transcript_69197/m.198482 type:complete len:327 (+) Transcript_69197:1006-1986(+)